MLARLRFPVILSVWLVLFLPSSLSAESEFGPRTFTSPAFTAVVAAYHPEIEALLAEIEELPHARIDRQLTFRGITYHLGSYRNEPILVFVTGISIANAAMSMQMAFDYFPIERVLYAGIAGGINPALEKGDVTVPARWYYHDESAYFNPAADGGYIVADYFKHYSYFFPENRPADPHIPNYDNFDMIFPDDVLIVMEDMESPQPMPYFSATPSLLAVADRAINRLGPLPGKHEDGRAKLFTGGNAATGSVFVDNADYRRWIHRVFDAEVTEMESAAVGQVCTINGVPWVVIRAVSDLAGGQEGKNEENVYDTVASEHAAKLLFAILEELAIGE